MYQERKRVSYQKFFQWMLGLYGGQAWVGSREEGYPGLAKKAKAEGLTPEELTERDKLRRIYIDSVKANLVGQLENTYIIGTDGVKRKVEKKS